MDNNELRTNAEAAQHFMVTVNPETVLNLLDQVSDAEAKLAGAEAELAATQRQLKRAEQATVNAQKQAEKFSREADEATQKAAAHDATTYQVPVAQFNPLYAMAVNAATVLDAEGRRQIVSIPDGTVFRTDDLRELTQVYANALSIKEREVIQQLVEVTLSNSFPYREVERGRYAERGDNDAYNEGVDNAFDFMVEKLPALLSQMLAKKGEDDA